MKSNQIINFLLYCSLGVFIFWLGTQFSGIHSASNYTELVQAVKSDPRSKDFDIDLFFNTMQTLEEKYVDKTKIDKQKMFYGAIKGMVASVDDNYTYFLTPEENAKTKDELAGKIQGIGALLEFKDKQILIVSVMKDSPAEKQGLKPGDVILKVNDKDVKDQVLTKVVQQIRGEKGSEVSVTISRQGKEQTYKMIRDDIQTNSLDLSYEKAANCDSNCQQVALLQLHQFGDTTNDEWDKAVEEIEQKWQNGEIKGLVLDLRNNPGGYLQSAVYLTSDFIEKDNLIVKQESANSSISHTALPLGRLKDIPVSVILNKYSASAAEIMGGALKDYGRATIVGEKSFGKGSVQEAMELKNGAGLHVTVAKWILPKGGWINGKGIEPNIKVEYNFKEGDTYSKDKDAQLQKAIDAVGK